MDLELLERITRLMKENDLNTLDIRDGDKRIILKRGADVIVAQHSPAPMQHAPVQSHAGSSGASAGTASSAPPSDEANLLSIKSPMVGTFYSSPTPEAKAFVGVGSTVDEDSDVCIIEAMKVFNNIKAECRGTIAKVLCTNGQTVEFGQPLFLVKP